MWAVYSSSQLTGRGRLSACRTQLLEALEGLVLCSAAAQRCRRASRYTISPARRDSPHKNVSSQKCSSRGHNPQSAGAWDPLRLLSSTRSRRSQQHPTLLSQRLRQDCWRHSGGLGAGRDAGGRAQSATVGRGDYW
jgi:hypothetical protein